MASPAADATPSPSAWRPTRRVLAILFVAYWAYVVNGVVNSELGPVLPSLVHSFRVDLATAGTIFSAQFAGGLLGSLVSGVAADRWGYRRVLICSTLLMAVGLAGISLAGGWWLILALTGIAGFAFGVTDTLCNAIVAAQAPREGGAALNLLHMFFGVGALTGPLLVGALLTMSVGWRGVFTITGLLAFLCMVLVIAIPIPPPVHLEKGADRPMMALASVPKRREGSRAHLALLMGMIFLFVGMEQITGGWSTTYLNRVLGAHLDVAVRSVALYWAAVTVGRLAASAIALRITNKQLLLGSAVVTVVGLIALASSQGVGLAVVALIVLGLGLAPIYPTIVAVMAHAYPHRFATLAGLLGAAGALGGALFPWLGGAVAQIWDPRAAIWLGMAIAVAFLALFALFLGLPAPA